MKIAEEAGVNLTQDALEFIGFLAEGALRDGISILDHALPPGTRWFWKIFMKLLA